jgi:uncharacterized protein
MKWRLPSVLPSARHLRIALVFAVLAATGAQQLVAEAHWHSWLGTHASVAAPSDDVGATTDDRCLLCQVAAHAGAAAPPSAVHRFAADHNQVFHFASGHEAEVPAVPAHAWQSRGPPAA